LIAGAGYSHIVGKDEDTGNYLGVLVPDQFTLHTGFKLPNINAVVGWRAIVAEKFDWEITNTDKRDA